MHRNRFLRGLAGVLLGSMPLVAGPVVPAALSEPAAAVDEVPVPLSQEVREATWRAVHSELDSGGRLQLEDPETAEILSLEFAGLSHTVLTLQSRDAAALLREVSDGADAARLSARPNLVVYVGRGHLISVDGSHEVLYDAWFESTPAGLEVITLVVGEVDGDPRVDYGSYGALSAAD